MRGIFVTGTDTDVGKTFVSAITLMALREKWPVRYWKPVQTGIEAANDTLTIKRLTQCTDREILDRGYRLELPLSPHLSAKYARERIEIAEIVRTLRHLKNDHFWIVEGAGGVLVPLNESELMRDLIARLGLPTIVVARPTLGTINHTLLTLEALAARYIDILGVVLSGGTNDENKQAIEAYGKHRVLLQLPLLTDSGQMKLWATKLRRSLDAAASKN